MEAELRESWNVSSGASNLYNCPITTVSGGEVAECRSHSEARNATPGLGRSTSPSSEAAGEGANHRTDKSSCRYKLAQGTTVFTSPFRPELGQLPSVSPSNWVPKTSKGSMCLGRRPVDWLWRNPMVDASVSCQRARGRISLQRVLIVPRCTTIWQKWHQVCTIWTLKLEVAVVANGGPHLAVSCSSHALLGR